MFDFSVITDKFIKMFNCVFRYEPFSETDKQHRCRIFGYDTYTGHYGCAIEYPDYDLIIWTIYVERHPNRYYSHNFITF